MDYYKLVLAYAGTVVVQYVAIPYVSLTRWSPISVERIGAQYVGMDTGIRYPTYRYMAYGITMSICKYSKS